MKLTKSQRDQNRRDEEWVTYQQELSAAADVIVDREIARGVPFNAALCDFAINEAMRAILDRPITD